MKKLLSTNTWARLLRLLHPALAFAALLLALPNAANGQITYTWDGEGPNNNWSDATNWNPNGLPSLVDTVIISNGATVNVNLDAFCAKVILEGGSSATRLNFNSGKTLTVSGQAIIQGNTSGNADQFISIGSGSMSCSSLSMSDSGSDNRDCETRIGTGTLSVSGNIIMNGSDARNNIRFTGGGTLFIGGSMTGGGFSKSNNCTVNYNSASPQMVRPGLYANLTFSGGGEKTLGGAATVDRTCTFDDGIVNTTAVNLLIISNANNATAVGASNDSFVNGPVKKQGNDAFIFPVGKKGTGYAPIGISAPSNGSDITAEYFRAMPPSGTLAAGIDHISSIEYWQLTRASGTSDEQVTLGWRANSQVTDPPGLAVVSLNSGVWANWGNSAITGTIASGTVTSAIAGPINAYFTLGSVTALPANPLPVELVYFNGSQQNSQNILLRWRTASEHDNDYMAVEHSTDGRSFEEIGRVPGAGYTLTPQDYRFVDENPQAGLNYYRLRQVDFDGAATYHGPVSVTFKPREAAGATVSLYPNPAADWLHVSWPSPTRQPVTLKVISLAGSQVALYQAPAGVFTYSLPLAGLQAGSYLLEIRQGAKVENEKFIKH